MYEISTLLRQLLCVKTIHSQIDSISKTEKKVNNNNFILADLVLVTIQPTRCFLLVRNPS